MSIQIIEKEQYQTTLWSGGTTTQLFIYPMDASFEKRQFDLRVSTATIALKESQFTPLANYKRIIFTVDHPITIQHNDSVKKTLQPFQLHAFSGNDQTVSYGKCTDFNVMFNETIDVKVSLVTDHMQLNDDAKNYFIYCFKPIILKKHTKKELIHEGKSIFISKEQACVTLQMTAKKAVSAIVITF